VHDSGGKHPKDGGRKPEAGEAASPSLITIAGLVTDESGAAVPDRAVNVLDAHGVSRVGVTDSSGHFRVEGVVAPYDLAVGTPPGGVPIVYTGLTTSKPRLWGYAATPATSSLSSAFISFTLDVPDCGGECTVFPSGFANGQSPWGVGTQRYASLATVPVTVQVGWSGAASASAGVDVLVANSTLTSFWYVQVPASVTNGASVAAGTYSPGIVPLASTLTLTDAEQGIPTGWSVPTLAIDFNFAGGGSIALANAETSILTAGVPNVLGGTVSVSASSAFSVAGGTEYSAAASAVQPNLPLTSTTATPTLYAPATWLTPRATGAPSNVPLGSALKWAPYPSAPGGFDFLEVSSTSPWALLCFVFTSDASVSLPDLAKLGVTLAPGPATVMLEELRPLPTLDDVLEAGQVFSIIDSPWSYPVEFSGSQVDVTFSP
jgi:hypothetical protein